MDTAGSWNRDLSLGIRRRPRGRALNDIRHDGNSLWDALNSMHRLMAIHEQRKTATAYGRFAPVPLVEGKLRAVREAGQNQHLKPPILFTTSPNKLLTRPL